MEKKVGIRLRHLEPQTETQRHHPINNDSDHQAVQPSRRRQRSQSPLNRRKIFVHPNTTQYTEQNLPKNQQKYPQKPKPPTPQQQLMSPILNQPLNSNNNISLIQNNQYQSQIQRLVDSLKKKSIQLQKKQQTINKLKRQIQFLKAQNSQFVQQIKSLKAQIQYQKTLRIKASNNGDVQKYQGHGIANTNIISNLASKPVYKNQPYEQFSNNPSQVIHVKINPKKLEQRQQYPVNKQLGNRQQDSMVSQYLSPLMVLNSQKNNKTSSPFFPQFPQKIQNVKEPKSSSRISYDTNTNNGSNNYNWDRQQNKNKQNNYTNYNSSNQNMFNKKPIQTQLYQQQQNYNSYPNNIHKLQQQNYSPIYQASYAQSLQNNSAYFSTNQNRVQQNNNYSCNFNKNTNTNKNTNYEFNPNQHKRNVERSNKQLAIDDSKQFHFEDFDFSELDNQIGNSKF